MNKIIQKIAVAVIVLAGISHASRAGSIAEIAQADIVPIPEAIAIAPLTHQQLVWTYALEWCESRGILDAINPNDLDNTPSYYSFQFKPDTFRGFGTKYGIIPTSTTAIELKKLMRDYPTERLILEAMVRDAAHINWYVQFPGCVKKLGLPQLSTL